MRDRFAALFGESKPLVGVVHLEPLPGSPRYESDPAKVLETALLEIRTLSEGGIRAIILENFGDAPFYPDRVPVETVASLAAIAARARDVFSGPLGINVLRNDGAAALAIAEAVGAQFIRVNVLVGSAFTDQGLIQGQAHRILRLRSRLGSSVAILADVMVKHATPPPGTTLLDSARDTWSRGFADALIVTGGATGAPSSLDDVRAIKEAIEDASVLVGSGVTPETVREVLESSDGAIVGTSLKVDGRTTNRVESRRVEELVRSAGPDHS